MATTFDKIIVVTLQHINLFKSIIHKMDQNGLHEPRFDIQNFIKGEKDV